MNTFLVAVLIGVAIGALWQVIDYVSFEISWERARRRVLAEHPELDADGR